MPRPAGRVDPAKENRPTVLIMGPLLASLSAPTHPEDRVLGAASVLIDPSGTACSLLEDASVRVDGPIGVCVDLTQVEHVVVAGDVSGVTDKL